MCGVPWRAVYLLGVSLIHGHIGMTANQVLLQRKGEFFPDNLLSF